MTGEDGDSGVGLSHADASIKLDCDCIGRCSILCADFNKHGFDGDHHQWLWEFFTNSGYEHSFRHRLRICWNVIRGKEHFFHGTVHSVDDMKRLQNFLEETLPA